MGRKSKKDVSRIIWAQLPVCRRIRCLIVEELTNVKSCQEIKLTQLLQDVENSEHDVTTTLTRLKLVAAYISENLQKPLPNVAVNVLIKYFIISTPQQPIRGVLASILETTTHYNDGSLVFTTFGNTLEEYLDLTTQEFDIEENRHVIELLNACVGMTLGLKSIQVHIGKVIYFLKLSLDKLLSLGDLYQQPGSTECDIAALLKCNTQILKRLHFSNKATLFTVEDTENLTQVMLNCRHISAKEEFGWDCCSAASMTLLVIWQAMYASPELLKKVKDTLSNFATENSCCIRTCLSFCNGTMVSVDWNMLVMNINNVEDGPHENLLLQYIFPLLRNTKERCKTISDRVIVAKCFVHWTSIALKASKQCALEFEQWFMISTIGNSEMENLISYALEELEHPADAIRHQANEMLVNLLNIASNISDEDFSSGLVTTTMSQNWQKRSTFTALKCILDHVSPDKVLQQNGDILNKLLHAMHHQSLAPYSSQAYVTLASKCRKSMETMDLSTSLHQLNTFMKPLLKTMCKCSTNSLRLLIDYPFVKLLKIYKEDCIEYIFTYFKQELDCGGQFSFSNAQTLAAFLSCMKCTVANGLLKNHNITTHDTAINNLIQSSLVHENHDIRHLGFALLCESTKPSNLIAPSVLDSIKSALPFNFLCQDPAFRQRLLCSLKKLLLQIDGNITYVMKAQKSGKNSDACEEDGLLSTYCNFVSWICEFALSQLYPSAPYPKRITCISIVCLVVDIFIKNTGKHWKFQPSTVFTPETIHSLTVLLSDPYDDVTHLSFTVLANEQLRNTVLSALSPDWLENLYTTSLDRAYKCGKPEWCGDTACRLKLYCVLLSSETGPSHNQILTRVCSKLLSLLNESISKANRNLYLAANCFPMYGLLHCIRILLKCINFSTLDSGSLVEWRHMISSLVTACFQVASAVLPVVGSVSPEGHLPDIGKSSSDEVDGGLDDAWNELPDAIKSLVIGENSLDDQDERKTRAFAQQILVCCWRSAKESSLLLQEISTSRFPLDSSSSVSDGVLSWDQLLRIGEHLRKQLMEARHRGAFEIAYYAFKAYCPRLWNIYHRELSKTPVEWLDSILLDVQDPVRSKNLCATRRSAGLPFCMQALLSGNKTTQGRKHLHHAMLLLLSLCEVSDTEGLLPKVHSLNIIRGLVKDASLGEEILPYVSQCLQVALTGFNSSIWAVRNSSTLLFSALFTRVFGVKHDKDDYLSLKNRLSGNEFFSLLPGLHSFLAKQFEVICDLLKKGSHYALSPSLHPILLLLSRVYPSTMQSTSGTSLHVFIPLLIECRASAVYKTRIAASHALASILNWNQSVEVLENCTKNLKDDVDIARGLKKEMTNVNSSPQNRIHGGLLQIKEIVLASERQHDHHFLERFEAIMKILSCVYEHVLPFLVSKLNNCPLTAATSLDLFLCIENRRAKITNKRSDDHSWKRCFEMCMRSSIEELRDSVVSRSHVPGYTFLLDTAAEVAISLEERAENITSLMTHLIEFGEFNALRSLMKSLLSLWPQMTNKFAYQDLHIRLEELLSNAILTKSYSDEIAELIYRLLTEVASSASAETLLVQATERSINCNPSQASYMEALLNFQSKCVGIIIRNNLFGSLSDIIGPWICVLSAASQPHENTDDVRLAVADSLVANTSLLFADGKNRLVGKGNYIKALYGNGKHETIMENFVKSILPNFGGENVLDVLEELKKLGVECEEDLQFVKEEELLGVMKPVHARKLLSKFEKDCSAPVTEIPPDEIPSSSASNSSASGSSVNLTSIGWAYNFNIPWDEFPEELMENCRNETRPSRKNRKEMVRILTDHICRITKTPKRKNIELIAYSLVAKYPKSFMDVIDGEAVGSGYGQLVEQINNKIENAARRLKGFHPNATLAKEKRAGGKRKTYGCKNWEGNDSQSQGTLQESEDKLLAEYKKSVRDGPLVEIMMKETYFKQRQDINKNLPVKELMSKWPFLFEEQFMNDHFYTLIGKENKQEFLDNLNEKSADIFKTMKALAQLEKFPVGLQIQEECQTTGNTSPMYLRGLELLSSIFNEDVAYVYKLFRDDTPIETILSSLPPTPTLVALGESLATAKSFMVSVEKIIVVKLDSFLAGVAYTFECYFVFNMVYPRKAIATLEFIQRYFAKINAYGTKSSEKKIRHEVNPKVLNILLKINDHLEKH